MTVCKAVAACLAGSMSECKNVASTRRARMTPIIVDPHPFQVQCPWAQVLTPATTLPAQSPVTVCWAEQTARKQDCLEAEARVSLTGGSINGAEG